MKRKVKIIKNYNNLFVLQTIQNSKEFYINFKEEDKESFKEEIENYKEEENQTIEEVLLEVLGLIIPKEFKKDYDCSSFEKTPKYLLNEDDQCLEYEELEDLIKRLEDYKDFFDIEYNI